VGGRVGLAPQLFAEQLLHQPGRRRLAGAGVRGQRVGELGGRLEAMARVEGQRPFQDRPGRVRQPA